MWNLHEYVTHWYYQKMHSYSCDLLGKACSRVGYSVAREIFDYFRGETDIAHYNNHVKGWRERVCASDDEWFKEEMEDYYKWSKERHALEYETESFMI
jgi:hypothetical protein